MVDYDSYYDLLDVDRDATPDEIRAAYREKAKDYHPDVSDHPEAEELFKALTDAKEILTDKAERTQYDKDGHTAYTTETSTEKTEQPTANARSNWSPSSEDRRYDETFGQGAANKSKQRNRHPNGPDPDDWVGEPGWSKQTEQTQQNSWKETTDQSSNATSKNWAQDPSYIIPDSHLQSSLLVTFLVYTASIYGIFSPTTIPLFTLIATVTLPIVFLVLAATRLGFYVFPLAVLVTPLLLMWNTPLEPSSIRLLTATMISIFGVLITLLVSSIRPS